MGTLSWIRLAESGSTHQVDDCNQPAAGPGRTAGRACGSRRRRLESVHDSLSTRHERQLEDEAREAASANSVPPGRPRTHTHPPAGEGCHVINGTD